MVDVKVVLGRLLASGVVAGVLVLGGTASLAARRASRSRAPAALLRGSQLALGLLFAVGILMLVGWQLFFVGFHELFFESGTWSFAYSDTLIRLYPERFWMDVGAVVVGLMVTEILLIGAGAFLWNRALDRRADDPAR
jgi:integral membrane protein (TIGR01906 family)